MDYWIGTDILGDLGNRDIYEELDLVLGAESKITVEDVTPPSYVSTMSPVAPSSPILEYGPPLSGAGSPVRYTDKTTVMAVQKKLQKLGYFHGVVDGIYGPVTAAAIKNYSGKDGPPDDALLAKLGLKQEMTAFEDEVIESTVLQTKQAQTQPQVKAAADQTVALAPPKLQQEAAKAQQAAAMASTPQQVAQAKQQVQTVIEKIKAERPMPGWKVGVIAASSAVGVAALFGLVTLLRRK